MIRRKEVKNGKKNRVGCLLWRHNLALLFLCSMGWLAVLLETGSSASAGTVLGWLFWSELFAIESVLVPFFGRKGTVCNVTRLPKSIASEQHAPDCRSKCSCMRIAN